MTMRLVGTGDKGREPESHLATWIRASPSGHPTDWSALQQVNLHHMDGEGAEFWGTTVVTTCWVPHLAPRAEAPSLTPTLGSLDVLCHGPPALRLFPHSLRPLSLVSLFPG